MTYKDCSVCGMLMIVCDTKYRDGRVARYCPNCNEVRYPTPDPTWDDVPSGNLDGEHEAPEYMK